MSKGNLILNRARGQSINIYVGTEKIKITRYEGDRLGVRADQSVTIVREEIDKNKKD